MLWNEAVIESRFKKGYGQGVLENYSPFIHVEDFGSIGRSRLVSGCKLNREHHLFSDIEYLHFVLDENDPSTIDIREQFPLERKITCRIAQDLGFQHPVYPGTKVPTVMTTDLLITYPLKSSYYHVAKSVKLEKDLKGKNSARIKEKQLIESTYWNEHKIRWSIRTDKDINKTEAFNIANMRCPDLQFSGDRIWELGRKFRELFREIWQPDKPLIEMVVPISITLNLSRSLCTRLFYFQVWNRKLQIDLKTSPILPDFPVRILEDEL